MNNNPIIVNQQQCETETFQVYPAPPEQLAIPIGPPGPQGPAGPPGAASTLPAINFAFGDATPVTIHTLAARAIVTEISVIFRNAFNGTNASLRIGTSGAPELLMAANQNAPSQAAQFATSPGADLPSGTNLVLTIAPGSGATAGSGVILISLTPAS